MRVFAVLAFVLALPVSGREEEFVYAGVGDALPGYPETTYLSLLKQVAPDLSTAADGTAEGHLAKPLRYTANGDQSAAAGEPVAIGDVTALPVRAEGEDRLLLLADLGDGGGRAESFSILALVDMGRRRKFSTWRT